MRTKYIIIKALKEGVLTYNRNGNVFAWKNGNIILQVPPGVDYVEYFVKFTLDPSGMELLKVVKKELMIEDDSDSISVETSTNTDAKYLFDEGLKHGVIVKKGLWYSTKERKNFGRGDNQGISTITESLSLQNEIKSALEELKGKNVEL